MEPATNTPEHELITQALGKASKIITATVELASALVEVEAALAGVRVSELQGGLQDLVAANERYARAAAWRNECQVQVQAAVSEYQDMLAQTNLGRAQVQAFAAQTLRAGLATQ